MAHIMGIEDVEIHQQWSHYIDRVMDVALKDFQLSSIVTKSNAAELLSKEDIPVEISNTTDHPDTVTAADTCCGTEPGSSSCKSETFLDDLRLCPQPENSDDKRYLIKKGHFGDYLVRMKSQNTAQLYAVKRFDLAEAGAAGSSLYVGPNEAKVLGRLKHSNIVQHVTSFYSGDQRKYDIIMELVDSGATVATVLRQYPRPPFEMLLKWLKQTSSALSYAHSKRVSHKYLKPTNLLLTASTHEDIKICGFGQNDATGSLLYMSPEVFAGSSGSASRDCEKSDVWAVGCIFAELLGDTTLPRLGGAICDQKDPAAIKRRKKLLHAVKRNIVRQSLGNQTKTIRKALEYDIRDRCSADFIFGRCLQSSTDDDDDDDEDDEDDTSEPTSISGQIISTSSAAGADDFAEGSTNQVDSITPTVSSALPVAGNPTFYVTPIAEPSDFSGVSANVEALIPGFPGAVSSNGGRRSTKNTNSSRSSGDDACSRLSRAAETVLDDFVNPDYVHLPSNQLVPQEQLEEAEFDSVSGSSPYTPTNSITDEDNLKKKKKKKKVEKEKDKDKDKSKGSSSNKGWWPTETTQVKRAFGIGLTKK